MLQHWLTMVLVETNQLFGVLHISHTTNIDMYRKLLQDAFKMWITNKNIGSDSIIIRFLFYYYFGFCSPLRSFHSFWVKSVIRWGENGTSPRKNAWPTTSKTWTELGSNPQRWFRALKISVLNHSVLLDNKRNIKVSLVTRKPVFGISDQWRLKPACWATETS